DNLTYPVGCCVARAMFHSYCLRDRDLYVFDVVLVPDGLEDPVGEPEHQDILHRLLAEIVIDPEDLGLPEHAEQRAVEVLRAGQVPPDRLFDDHPGPGMPPVRARGRPDGQPVLSEALDDLAVQLRRRGEVVEAVARGPAL